MLVKVSIVLINCSLLTINLQIILTVSYNINSPKWQQKQLEKFGSLLIAVTHSFSLISKAIKLILIPAMYVYEGYLLLNMSNYLSNIDIYVGINRIWIYYISHYMVLKLLKVILVKSIY